MARPTVNAFRRWSRTFLVLAALLVASVVGHAASTASVHADRSAVASAMHVEVHALADDGGAGTSDQDPVPSIEDHHGGLDDTFGLPPQHAVQFQRLSPVRPRDAGAGAHAHHHSQDLRPPIG